MASYPTSVFAPAARTNGQTIDASHVQGLQDEVSAIESALEGTLTHSLNVSGASTLATLSAAASTLASLQCAGSTFTVRPLTPPPDAVRVFMESTGAIGSSANSTLSFTGEDFKTNASLHSTSVNPERLTPQSTGLYLVSAGVDVPTPSSFSKGLQLRDSSVTVLAQHQSPSTRCFLSVTGLKRFDVLGGWVTASVNNPETSTLSVSSGSAFTWFSMVKL